MNMSRKFNSMFEFREYLHKKYGDKIGSAIESSIEYDIAGTYYTFWSNVNNEIIFYESLADKEYPEHN